jgi:outer membrane receptor for ferrienterochelin and colicins
MNTCLLIFVASLNTASAVPPGSVHGLVRAAETGDPLYLADVRLVASPPSDFRWGGVTIATGEFVVENLAPGEYQLTVTYAGREGQVLDLVVGSGGVVEVTIDLLWKVYEINPIVTSVSRRKEKVLESPARVQVIGEDETRSRTVLTSLDHLEGKPAIDVARTGLSQGMVVVRGFNNVFSGATLTLVDQRIAHMPALRYNAFDLIPTSYDDIKQIEVVSGPGSALYGPNSANGVVHIQTLSAFDAAGTRLTLAGGNREVWMASGRHAKCWGDGVGLKVTAQYQQGEDFPYDDPAETIPRDNHNEKVAVEGRLDIRPKQRALFVLSGGWNSIDAVELTPLGASQASGLGYAYGQARMTWGEWFAQTYITRNDAGDSFNLRTGEDFIDTSKLIVGEVQRGWTPHDRLILTSGIDVLLTRPETGGTIDGRNEDNDNINEIGGYLQSETRLPGKWSLAVALRLDKHSRLVDPVLSPRIAVMNELAPGQKIRVSYNRAFSTPTSTNLFLDLLAGEDIFSGAGLNGYDLWAKGVPESGFHFQRDAMGGVDGLYMQVPEAMGGTPNHIPADATSMWPFLQQMVPALGAVPAPTPAQVSSVLGMLDPGSGSFVSVAPADVSDIQPLEPTITNTIELGYTTLFGERLLLTADVYHSRIEHFVGPLRIETPNVFMDRASLSDYLVLNGFSAAQADAIAAQIAGVPLGTVTPEEALDPADLFLTYRNFGTVDLSGLDLSAQIHLNASWAVSLNYSYVSHNLFENVEGGLDVALNAPRNKAGAGVEYRSVDQKAGAGVRLRYVDGFPVQSGVYSGYVDSYALADLTASYEIMRETQLGLTVQNVFDDTHQEFTGAPFLGRTALLRLTRTF